MTLRPSIALVLGAGGFRGRASLGVLRRLRCENVPIDAIVGVSAGALIAGYHAGVGWPVDECIGQVSQLGSRMLLAYGASRSRIPALSRMASGYAGRIEEWLTLLDRASFDVLHHGVKKIGILAFDLRSRRLILFATGQDNDGLGLGQAVRGSAAVPFILGPFSVKGRSSEYRLIDGGLVDSVPVERAFAPPISADCVIAVDIGRDPRGALRRRHLAKGPLKDRLVILRPRVGLGGTIVTRRGLVSRQVEAGERAVTPDALSRIRSWLPETPKEKVV
ncbi:MAG: hypothetical protein DMF49_00785 [Acidobacteria bacterium]|nr:MAG: hypothetical protein DMF49_00785 [Acidobacteriota bacterium]